MGFILAISAALSGVLVYTVNARNFDLLCEGTQIEGLVKKTETTFSERIKVDLDQMQWCKSTCHYIKPIIQANPDTIVLDDSRTGSTSNRETLDRREGIYTQVMLSGIAGLSIRRHGVCEVVEFTGFPVRKF